MTTTSEMNADAAASLCPYKGLQPYTEADREYFFGRENDREIIASNLYVAPVTVLYGTSGVGKSSVLRAGVIPRLKEKPRVAVVFFNSWQDESFGFALKQEVLRAVSESVGQSTATVRRELAGGLGLAMHDYIGRLPPGLTEGDPVSRLALDELLAGCAEVFRLSVLLIFDQFEEYFLYHAPPTKADNFEAVFARAVNRHESGVNFMLSMREEELSKLDRFLLRIPHLLTNLLRLGHLDDEAATSAIRDPLKVYSDKYPEQKMEIEDGLVTAIIEQVRPEQFADGESRLLTANMPAARSVASGAKIETPFLQLVLTRLWKAEQADGSHVLRLDTFKQMGEARTIARAYLDEMMDKLDARQRVIASSVLRFLVTPTGSKIAQPTVALSSWVEVDEKEVESVLTLLSSGREMRILRKVTLPGQPELYELFHDALGPAILEWRARYEQSKKQAEAERIVREHVGQVMSRLSEPERDIASLIFSWMITTTGVRLLVQAENLSGVTAVSQAEVEIVLNLLSAPDAGILRGVMRFPTDIRYEIADDITAGAILDWRKLYWQERRAQVSAPDQIPPPPRYVTTLGTYLLGLCLLLLSAFILYSLYSFWPVTSAFSEEKSYYRLSGTSTPVSFLFWKFLVSNEVCLTIVMLLSGALGGLVQSIMNFIRTLNRRVMTYGRLVWYLFLPLPAAVLGWMFYLSIRGGVLSPDWGIGAVNPFGLAAVSALAGLFTPTALERLRWISEGLLTRPATPPGGMDDHGAKAAPEATEKK